MNTRDARTSDAEAVRVVHYESIRELGMEAYSEKQVNAWARGCESADYASAIASEELEFVITEADERLVGFGSLNLGTPDGYEAEVDAEITGVYVHPSYARKGIGTRIYLELERRGRARGIQTLGLSATLNAVPFYENHGFQRIRDFRHEFSSQKSTGVTGVIVEMKKDL